MLMQSECLQQMLLSLKVIRLVSRKAEKCEISVNIWSVCLRSCSPFLLSSPGKIEILEIVLSFWSLWMPVWMFAHVWGCEWVYFMCSSPPAANQQVFLTHVFSHVWTDPSSPAPPASDRRLKPETVAEGIRINSIWKRTKNNRLNTKS